MRERGYNPIPRADELHDDLLESKGSGPIEKIHLEKIRSIELRSTQGEKNPHRDEVVE